MSRRIWPLAVGLFAIGSAAGQVPPGYHIEQLTTGPAYDYGVSMNNIGQIVFSERLVPDNGYTSEIFLYDANTRVLTRLTNDNVIDAFPDINDVGTIVWSRAVGAPGPYGPTFEIARYENGVQSRMTYDGMDDWAPRINVLGHFVWYKWFDQGCDTASANIYWHNGSEVLAVTNDDWSNQGPEINDLDQIVWSQRDFCGLDWNSKVLLYSGGQISQLSPDDVYAPDAPTINNRGQVVWNYDLQDPTGDSGLQIWENGSVRVLTDWGMNAHLNDQGDLYFIRWYEASRTYQAWIYRSGEYFQLSSDPFWNTDGCINESGAVAWQSGNYPNSDIRFLRRFPTGDMNCDGTMNAFDIQAFVMALTDHPRYQQTYPTCDYTLADASADGSVNLFDIQQFVDILAR